MLHKRRFFYIKDNEVDRERERPAYSTIVGTRKLHCVSSVGTPGTLKTRQLSCYCFSCLHGHYLNCDNQDYVDNFKVVKFSDYAGEDESDEHENESDEHENQVDQMDHADSEETYDMISTVVCKDSIVAIKPSSDSFYDFFLFHVTSDGVINIEDVATDNVFGHRYPNGTKVICGYYYEAETVSRKSHRYKAKPESQAVIPKDCVLYFGFELEKSESAFLYLEQ